MVSRPSSVYIKSGSFLIFKGVQQLDSPKKHLLQAVPWWPIEEVFSLPRTSDPVRKRSMFSIPTNFRNYNSLRPHHICIHGRHFVHVFLICAQRYKTFQFLHWKVETVPMSNQKFTLFRSVRLLALVMDESQVSHHSNLISPNSEYTVLCWWEVVWGDSTCYLEIRVACWADCIYLTVMVSPILVSTTERVRGRGFAVFPKSCE